MHPVEEKNQLQRMALPFRKKLFGWLLTGMATVGVIGGSPAADVADGKTSDTPVYPPPIELPASVQVLSPIEAYGFIKLNPGVNLIDLRDAWEVEQRGHIEGASRMSYMEQTFRQHFHMAVLRKNEPILMYCALGNRARRAAKVALELGYRDIVIIDGGIRAWMKAGLPIKK